ncbi:MAG: cytochrome c-type biogenesis CcmF C-terminal domain-containing protein, partial [Ilumatobacter sp.]
MSAALGSIGVMLAFVASIGAAIVLVAAVRGSNRRLGRLGGQLLLMILLGSMLAFGAMEWALVTHDFSLQYVASNHSLSTPLLYTIASAWGALEGSILLWGLILAGYITVIGRRYRSRFHEPLVGWAFAVAALVAAFFFMLMVGPANPFTLLPGRVPLDGRGPNPLLQNHPLMAFHPPILYLGYVGFTIPFAFATASLITGEVSDGWLSATRRTTLFAWGCLTVGIGLGGWWSYEVLGWGGYWAWDPVENASLLPWLTGTAYLHSVIMQERRGMLRLWNLSLVVATFCLTILGTFLTRSGVINSVHAFSQSAIGPLLLAFLGVCATVSILLVAWRAEQLRSPGQIDSPVSREAAFLVNNLLFAAFMIVVLLGTVFPLLVEAYDGRQISVGEPYFDDMTRPVAFALLFLMGAAPLLPWRAAGVDVLHRRLIVPAATAVGVMVIAVVAGLGGVSPVVAVGLASFALTGIASQLALAVRGHRARHRRSWPRATVGAFAGQRRLFGGLIVHAGVAVVAVALAIAPTYSADRSALMGPGDTIRLRSYEITYLDSNQQADGDRTVETATFGILQDGRD